MAKVIPLTYNVFKENTYIVYDESGECVIFDPGCSNAREETDLAATIDELGLKPVRLINTHCHIDHILGNKFVATRYQLALEIHRGELPVLQSAPKSALLFGLPIPGSAPLADHFLEEGDRIEFGQTSLKILLTPGHSPASLSFFCEADRFLIAGDVLFYGSIGRTDLPGGDYDTLIHSIRRELFPLGDEVQVYPGHGQATSIGFEKKYNPFLT